MKTLMALDGNNLLHRAFYALPIMETPDGVYTNAVYGFLSMLTRLVADYQPEYLAVAFDLHGPTFRHLEYPEYKAGRRETPEELRPQFQVLKDFLSKTGIPMVSAEGFEADDLLASMGDLAKQNGLKALLVSGDRDTFQLIDQDVTVLYTHRGVTDVDALTPEALKEKFGYGPERVTDLKALMGDSSDNIPGIPGVGPKTALKLIEQFPTLEDILAHPEQALKGAMLRKVQEGADSARLSKRLATIRHDAPMETALDGFAMPDLHTPAVYDALEELDMQSLIQRLQRSAPKPAALAPSFAVPEAPARGEPAMLRQAAAAQEWLRTLNAPYAIALWPHIEAADLEKQARLCIREDLLSDGMQPEEAYAALGTALNGQPAYYHDAKQALAELHRQGITPPPVKGDAYIAGYLLLPPGGKLDVEDLAQRVLNRPGESGAGALLDAARVLEERIKEDGLEQVYRGIELPLTQVLLDMEREGFAVDAPTLKALGEQYDTEMAALQREIHQLAGEEFNINSPKQLGVVLFEKLNLPAAKKTKTGYSTDAEVLEQLQHPIAAKVLEYRTLSKLKGTYIDGLLAVVDSGGRVHTTFHQLAAATGRISSAEPNLQNIPVRTELGRAIRGAFVAGREGWVLVDADYSQIELRVLAHMSGDENMQEAFRLGQDIHTRTASEIFGVPMESVTPSMRSSAKAVNFGVVYGISDFGLARNTGITRAEARSFIDMYFARYPGVRRFMDECVATGKAEGFVRTMAGRRRYLPELSSSNYNRRSFGERAAMNTPIQGTAADIIKLAMVKVSRALREGGLAARLILQVHDELIVEAPKEEAEAVKSLLIREMEQSAALDVPLVVDVGVGVAWNAAK